jgi:hypothetical protein
MICKNCPHKDVVSVPDDIAFDTEFKQLSTKEVDFCLHNHGECDDEYDRCEYRDIVVEAQHIQHAINMCKGHHDYKTYVIEHLNKILLGEI